MEEIIHGSPYSKEGGVEANGLRTGDEAIATTVRNPYDVIVTWWLRATRGEGSFVEFIRDYSRKPQLDSAGEIFTHRKHCDVVMRYENLAEDFRLLMEVVGLPQVEIPIDNTTKGKASWETYYDDDSLAEVERRFGMEIEDLGYSLARSSVGV